MKCGTHFTAGPNLLGEEDGPSAGAKDVRPTGRRSGTCVHVGSSCKSGSACKGGTLIRGDASPCGS